MELFNANFVHFMWDDTLKGKKGFFADSIYDLRHRVNDNSKLYSSAVSLSDSVSMPFIDKDECPYMFFYYDPNYDVKRAYNEGKQIQYRLKNEGTGWFDCEGEPWWSADCEYRIKSSIVHVILDRIKSSIVHVILDSNGNWATTSEYSEEKHGQSFKAFNDLDTAMDWVRRHAEWSKVAKAWKEGKQTQFCDYRHPNDWIDCNKPEWVDCCDYRIKPKSKRMTYRQLSEWLSKGNGQYRLEEQAYIHEYYNVIDDNKELPDEYKIRRWGSDEWIEPTYTVYIADVLHERVL